MATVHQSLSVHDQSMMHSSVCIILCVVYKIWHICKWKMAASFNSENVFIDASMPLFMDAEIWLLSVTFKDWKAEITWHLCLILRQWLYGLCKTAWDQGIFSIRLPLDLIPKHTHKRKFETIRKRNHWDCANNCRRPTMTLWRLRRLKRPWRLYNTVYIMMDALQMSPW